MLSFTVKQECDTVVSSPAAVVRDGSFVVQDLSPSAPSAYWTAGGVAEPLQQQQMVTCVAGGHPAGSTASSSSSFMDDESTSYEDITYNCGYGPSSAAALQAAANNCDYGGLYSHLHQQYGGGGYYDGIGYHQLAAGYDDKPPPYDNNNAADACDMNAAAVAYNDPYGHSSAAQQVRIVCELFLCHHAFCIISSNPT